MSTVPASLFLVLFVILPAYGQPTPEDACDQEMSKCTPETPIKVTGADSVDVAIYYDVDKAALDFDYVVAACTALKTLTHATFKFYPGLSTKVKDNVLTCYHPDKTNTDCTDSFIAACASQLVNDFTIYVCCTADGGSSEDCFKAQNPEKKNEFDQCSQQQHPTIKPADILLANREAAKAVDPAFKCAPIMSYNGVNDICTDCKFLNDTITTLCAMLAPNKDNACPKPQ